MTHENFITKSKQIVADYTNKNAKSDGEKISANDVYIVWSCKTLQNSKAMLATPAPDNLYFECTMNGDKGLIYLDVYAKIENVLIS